MKIRTASIDSGFDALKAYFGGLNGHKVYIPNVVLPSQRTESLFINEGNALDELHVKITSDAVKNNGVYMVGTLASRFSTADQSSIHDRKGESDQTMILMLTAIAYDAAISNVNDEIINVDYLLSTGLPIDESKMDGSRAKFAEKLKNGMHQVEFLETPGLKNKKVRINFADVYVNTEGNAAMINITMDDSYKPRNIDLLKKNVLISDMGGNTTDFAVIRAGKIDNEYSSGVPLGIGIILDDIIREVHSKHRYPFKTRRELVECIIADDPYIVRPKGSPESIKEIVDKHLKSFAVKQYKELEYMWNRIGNLHAIQAVGGTAYLLKDFLIDLNIEKSSLILYSSKKVPMKVSGALRKRIKNFL